MAFEASGNIRNEVGQRQDASIRERSGLRTGTVGVQNYGSTQGHYEEDVSPTSSHEESRNVQYEEFFNGTLPCPSCLGSGRIPRESEHLLALIPVQDKRLRPRRTGYYVAIAVSICILVATLLLFFIYPRTVVISNDAPSLYPTSIEINDTERILTMTIMNIYNISNSNFYAVSVDLLSGQVFFDLKLVGDGKNETSVKVPMRGHGHVYLSFNISIPKEDGYISKYCASPGRHVLNMPFQTTMQTSYLGRTYQDSIATFQHVVCSRKTEV